MELIHGNIFNTKCQTIVNTVNCYGVMGAGIALECKMRFPEMFERYEELCTNKQLVPGQLYLYKSDTRWVLNFPTKNHWKFPSKIEYLEKGLEKFVETFSSKGIESIAFPLLGSSHGGIDPEISMEIMTRSLKDLQIPIEIYSYDPKSNDDLLDRFKASLMNLNVTELKKDLGLTIKQADALSRFLKSNSSKSMNELHLVKGLGGKSIQKCYDYAMSERPSTFQSKLF